MCDVGPAGEAALKRDGSNTDGVHLPIVVVSNNDGQVLKAAENEQASIAVTYGGE